MDKRWDEVFTKKIQRIQRVFDIEKVSNAPTDTNSISKYYRINKIPYSIIYRGHDAVHLGITYGEIYDRKKDILEQAKIVSKYLNDNSLRVLELGTGRGINSTYLAKKFPKTQFTGLDLAGGHSNYAIKSSKEINNFDVVIGDFHDLSRFKNEEFDLIFVVEAICYASDDMKIFNEVNRILRKNGKFIVIDAFSDKKNLSQHEAVVKKIVEKGMAVPNFTQFEEFKKIGTNAGFELAEETDLSKNVIPTLSRVEKYANWFYGFPLWLQKLFVKIFPPEFSYNSISGYLMKDSIEAGLYRYLVFVFKKTS